MKKLLLTLATFWIVAGAIGQTVLKYETHGIQAESKNSMKLAGYIEPGISGKNAIWDFTRLALNSNFEGSAEHAGYSAYASVFQMANVVVEEFGNHFFFEVSPAAIEQHGFLSADGLTLIQYDVPFVKMKFPFSFGDSFKGPYQGTLTKNCSGGTISGFYAVEADGLGSLLLPGDVSYDNALRIKETKTYTQTVDRIATDVEIVTYRWFINEHRYPILTLIKKTFNYAGGKSDVTTQAAYNDLMISRPGSSLALNSLAKELDYSAYPNPFSDIIKIRFTLSNESHTNLSLFTLNGQLIKELINARLQPGSHSQELMAKETGLVMGTYLLKLNVDGIETSLKIVRM